jgi:EAL and modified HD-GYP domain-containing signal transduction protein
VKQESVTVVSDEAAPVERMAALRYVARQPILDLNGRVHAYELLYRSGSETAFHGDSDMATRTMLDNTVIFGLEKLTDGVPAFINCTAEVLTEQLVNVLPPSMTVLEILETVEPTPEVIEACRKLKVAGFRLALDDFVWEEKFEPLVKLANYIKVDFMLSGKSEREKLLQRLEGLPVTLLAEKVETQQEYEQAREEGFTLFQGYYFCRPVLLRNRKIPSNWISYLQVLQLMQRNPVDMSKLSVLIKRDAALTYRLLRLVNSPMFARRQEVRSIREALLMVGEDACRHMVILAITSEMNKGRPAEILRMSIVRGRCCELAAEYCALNPTEQYLLGMLSLLPAMLCVPMEELIPLLSLRKSIREALLGKAVNERCLLHWLECYEHGDWVKCDEIIRSSGLNETELLRCYGEALLWAEDTLSAH